MAASLSYLADEHVPLAVVRGLRQRGVDIVTVVEAGLRSAPDADLLEYARRERRVVFTQDEDFLRLHSQGIPHQGIVFARQHTAIGHMVRGLALLAEEMAAEDMVGHLEYV